MSKLTIFFHFIFIGFSGRYVSIDAGGELVGKAEAVGPREMWEPVFEDVCMYCMYCVYCVYCVYCMYCMYCMFVCIVCTVCTVCSVCTVFTVCTVYTVCTVCTVFTVCTVCTYLLCSGSSLYYKPLNGETFTISTLFIVSV